MSTTQRDAIRYFCQQKGMTEEELAKEINEAFENPTGEESIHVLNKGAAIGRREMLDKACKWLLNHNDYICGSTNGIIKYDMQQLVEDFKKYMEEEK